MTNIHGFYTICCEASGGDSGPTGWVAYDIFTFFRAGCKFGGAQQDWSDKHWEVSGQGSGTQQLTHAFRLEIAWPRFMKGFNLCSGVVIIGGNTALYCHLIIRSASRAQLRLSYEGGIPLEPTSI